MSGSIHTHFESRFDTANNLKEMCQNFVNAGFSKVAVTEHGAFSSFEDLRDIVKKNKIPLEIIPGVEGYFSITLPGDKKTPVAEPVETEEPNQDPVEETEKESVVCQDGVLLLEEEEKTEEDEYEETISTSDAHLVLIAKDYEGYLSLCKIITRSNEESQGAKPIITLDNLRDNVRKGHLVATSACIGGVFSLPKLKQLQMEKDIEELKNYLTSDDITKIMEAEEEYQDLKAKSEVKTVQKRKNAEKQWKLYHNHSGLDAVEQMEFEKEEAIRILGEKKEYFKEMHSLHIKKVRKAQRRMELLETELKKPLPKLKAQKELYQNLADIFGEENFYFELQNHGLQEEAILYNDLIAFAKKATKHPKFVASNDIHLGVTGESKEELDLAVKKRNVIQFTRYKNYRPIAEDDKEYYIKTDEKLKQSLLEIISDEKVVNAAMENIDGILSECHVEFPKDQKFYPKFCEDENLEFDKLILKGINHRFPNGFPNREYAARLKREIEVIKSMGYVGYHLIVQDYLNYARLIGFLPDEEIDKAPLDIREVEKILNRTGNKRIGLNIGAGRGSAAGSLVCYVLGITDIDPMPYDLLFERFLNVERVSMPKQKIGHSL